MKVVKLKTPEEDFVETFEAALKEANKIGATKMVISFVKDGNNEYISRTFKSDNVRNSEAIMILEISKSDVLETMRNG